MPRAGLEVEIIQIWPELTCLRILENHVGNPETRKIQTKRVRARQGACHLCWQQQTLSELNLTCLLAATHLSRHTKSNGGGCPDSKTADQKLDSQTWADLNFDVSILRISCTAAQGRLLVKWVR